MTDPAHKPPEVSRWDAAVDESTARFTDETTVTLLVGDTTFKVSRAKLCAVSSTMADLFTVPQPEGPPEPITLTNDVEDMKNFLWFLHVDPISFAAYIAECPKPTRFDRALGIASVAHMYMASSIERWAVQEMLDMFPDRNKEPSTFPRLHRQAERCATVKSASGANIGSQLFQQVRTDWCSQIQTTSDPVAMLLVARELGDTYLQAYSYFFILKLTNGKIGDDKRLTLMDHLRLTNGALNLRRYDTTQCPGPGNCYCRSCGRNNYMTHNQPPSQPSEETGWSPRVNCTVAEKFDTRSLWEMFEYSPMLRDNLTNVIEVDETNPSPVIPVKTLREYLESTGKEKAKAKKKSESPEKEANFP